MIGNRLSLFLLLLVLGFGALATWQWQALSAKSTAHIPPVAPPQAASEAASVSDDAQIPPLDELAQTLQRPLFAVTRRPATIEQVASAPAPTAKEAAPAAPIALELSAVILQPEQQFALFRSVAQSAMLRAQVGQSVDGWLVSEIRADGVSLQRGEEQQDLLLRTFKAPVRNAPPPTARAPTARSSARQAPGTAAADAKRQPRRLTRGPRRRSIQRGQAPETTRQ